MYHIMILIFGAIILLNIGVVLGYMFCSAIKRNSPYAGIIKITKEDDRILYSLELQDNPELLAQGDVVVFKVEASDESSNRK